MVSYTNPEEIYKLFICPCCGSTIDALCCESAIERKAYVDGLLDAGLDKTEIMVKMTSRYGLDSLASDSLKTEVREILIERAPEDRPQLVIYPKAYDLGNVSVSGGVVTTLVHLTNKGKTNLVIDDMETSCGCTSASIVYDGVEGPLFNMREHGNNPVGWSVSIRPGDTAILKVIYDPMVHPDLRGTVTRLVTIYSNDPIDPQTTFKLRLNQVD
jgi:hypothetical protein